MKFSWANILWFFVGGGIGYFVGDSIRKKIDSRKEEKEEEEKQETVTLQMPELNMPASKPTEKKEEPEEIDISAPLKIGDIVESLDEARAYDLEEDQAEEEHPEEEDYSDKSGCEQITMKDYYENKSGFEMCFVKYFDEDGILCDEDDNIIEDGTSIVTPDILDSVREYPGLTGFYVRNYDQKKDYEVRYIQNSYAYCVMGIEE